MNELFALRPTEKWRVIDVVQQAGVDVSDWANYEGGKQRAATNPKYCYEWSFVEPGKIVVLNLWYSDMKERNGSIVLDLNLRESAQKLAAHGGKPVWKARTERLDQAIQFAFRDRLPVRAVICDGSRRDRNNPNAEASKVKKRQLDPVPWAVASYNFRTGQCTLIRGALPNRLVDQFSIGVEETFEVERRSVTGQVFVRNPEVRKRALKRAAGRCEWCMEPGFVLDDGSVFLETHHVIPLSEDGRDTISNVVALCPNHHREAHHGALRMQMRAELLNMRRRQRSR